MKTKKTTIILLTMIFIIAIVTSTSSAIDRKIVLSGGSMGSVNNLAINVLAAIAHEFCGLLPTVIMTPTTMQEEVLANREADIATTHGFVTYNAYHGLDNWEGRPCKEMRSLINLPNSQVQLVVVQNSPVKKIEDLIGKTVVFSKQGSASDKFGKEMFSALGIEVGVDIRAMYLGFEDTMARMMTGTADAALLTGQYPHPSITELSMAARGGIRIIPLSEEEINTVMEQHARFVPTTIPPVYKGMEENIQSIEYVNLYSCVGLSEEEAYCLTKSFWENMDFAELQWAGVSRLNLEDTSLIKNVAPWHIGAYRYYKEASLEIPLDMVPPEAK